MKKIFLLLIILCCLNLTFAEECKSSFRIYNNTSETIIINNGEDVDTVPSGSYSYTWGACGMPVLYSAEGTYVTRSGGQKTCSYKSEGEWNYPSKNGVYESISITSICENEGETGIEIESFTNTTAKYAEWSKSSDPDKYAYGLEIHAYYKGEPLADVQFTITNKKNVIIKDVFGVEAINKTDKNGVVRFYLFAGYNYIVSQTKVNEKYSIQNGEIHMDSANGTILESKNFNKDNIEKYLEISFDNGLSDKEMGILNKIENEKAYIEIWKNDQKNKIEEEFNKIDYSVYNDAQITKIKDIKDEAYKDLEETSKAYIQNIESNVRKGLEGDYLFSCASYLAKVKGIIPHWEHFIIIGLAIVAAILHFIFNRHLLIDTTILAGAYILYIDYCRLSAIYLGILVAICGIFTILGAIFDNKEYNEGENETAIE